MTHAGSRLRRWMQRASPLKALLELLLEEQAQDASIHLKRAFNVMSPRTALGYFSLLCQRLALEDRWMCAQGRLLAGHLARNPPPRRTADQRGSSGSPM